MLELLHCAPPSSSGLGQGPLKAQTGVRFPLGAQKKVAILGDFYL